MNHVMRIFFLSFLLLSSVAYAQDLRYPEGFLNVPGSGSQQTFQINEAGDALEYCLIQPEATAVSKIIFGYEGRVGTPVQQKVGFQGINASTGRADGTYKTGTGECSYSYTPPASGAWDNSVRDPSASLTGTTCSLSRGERFCIKIEPVGTPNGSNLSGYVRSMNNINAASASEYHWTVDNNSGSPTVTRRGDLPIIAWGNGTRWYGYPANSYSQVGISSDTTPDEVALKFQNPCPTGQTYEISGLTAYIKIPSASKTVKFVLYDNTTVLQDVTYDSDQLRSAASNELVKVMFDEPTLSTLTCGSTYYLGVQPQETSSGLQVLAFNVADAAYMDAYPWGVNTHYASRSDGGSNSWTALTTRRPGLWPIINKYNAAAAGGGLTKAFNSGFQP